MVSLTYGLYSALPYITYFKRSLKFHNVSPDVSYFEPNHFVFIMYIMVSLTSNRTFDITILSIIFESYSTKI